MIGSRRRLRTVEQERRMRQLQVVGLLIVAVVTLLLMWMAMSAT